MKAVASVGCALVALVQVAQARLVAPPFGDGMVLQRDRPVPVWGKAEPKARVTVSFAGQTKASEASADGAWRVDLDPMPASKAPRKLVVASQTSQTAVSDVLVGEVWLCSGQSNMEMAMGMDQPRYGDGIGRMVAQVTHKPLIRHLKAPGMNGGWHALTPEYLTSGWRSCLAVHYALELQAQLDVPVGVVEAAVGGSAIARWIPANGEAADLYRRRVMPFAPYAIRGVLWYQGEADIEDAAGYVANLRLLHGGWRAAFGMPRLPFYYVQVAPGAGAAEHYPAFAEAQARFAEEEPDAAVTIVNDIGNVRDIHPNNKWLVAKRLALHALKRDYGYPDVEDCSPVLDEAFVCASNRVRLAFSHARSLYVYNDDYTRDAAFELAGADGVWRKAAIVNFPEVNWPAYGTLGTNVVELVAPGVAEPVRVRHLWQNPWKGCLYNQVNLPASLFRADLPYARKKAQAK